MHVQPPGAVATVALLLVYLLAAMLTIPWMLPFFLHAARQIAPHTRQMGRLPTVCLQK